MYHTTTLARIVKKARPPDLTVRGLFLAYGLFLLVLCIVHPVLFVEVSGTILKSLLFFTQLLFAALFFQSFFVFVSCHVDPSLCLIPRIPVLHKLKQEICLLKNVLAERILKLNYGRMMAMAQTIHWAYAEHHGFRLLLAKSSKGLCYVGSSGEGLVEMQQHCAKRFPNADFVQDQQALREYQYAIEAWLGGSRETSSLPLDVGGTEFQHSIWQALQEIPYGQTISYSELAERIGKPQTVRAAGSAVGANPLLLFIPCHRVIRKSGDVTGFRGGMELKHHLLETEKD